MEVLTRIQIRKHENRSFGRKTRIHKDKGQIVKAVRQQGFMLAHNFQPPNLTTKPRPNWGRAEMCATNMWCSKQAGKIIAK